MNESLGGQVYGSGEYLYGSDVNITALAAEGYNHKDGLEVGWRTLLPHQHPLK